MISASPVKKRSDFEGDEVADYLPRAELEIAGEESREEAMEVEDEEELEIFSEYDRSSDEHTCSLTQALGKSICASCGQINRTQNFTVGFGSFEGASTSSPASHIDLQQYAVKLQDSDTDPDYDTSLRPGQQRRGRNQSRVQSRRGHGRGALTRLGISASSRERSVHGDKKSSV